VKAEKGEYSMEQDSRRVISVCGLNCARCDIYEAGHGNDKVRDEIVEWFRKEQNETIKPEAVKCEGCRGPLNSHWSSDCKMMLCAKKRGVRYCFQCKDFPCKSLEAFSSDGISHHKRTVENMKKMKEIGIVAWIEEQKRKGHCVFCP
jgi:hypothetical protein